MRKRGAGIPNSSTRALFRQPVQRPSSRRPRARGGASAVQRGARPGARAHLPTSSFDMDAHLLPSSVWAAMMMASSSPLNGSFFTLGLSWFSHLRLLRHDAVGGRGRGKPVARVAQQPRQARGGAAAAGFRCRGAHRRSFKMERCRAASRSVGLNCTQPPQGRGGYLGFLAPN